MFSTNSTDASLNLHPINVTDILRCIALSGSPRCGDVSNHTAQDAADPSSLFVGNTSIAYTSLNDAGSENKAYYLIETLMFKPRWHADLSVRRDHWEAKTTCDDTRTLNATSGALDAWAPTSGAFWHLQVKSHHAVGGKRKAQPLLTYAFTDGSLECRKYSLN